VTLKCKIILIRVILLSFICITAYAQQGDNWYVDNQASGANNGISVITMDSYKTIMANYTLRQEQNIHYIRADVTGNNDGSDWDNAYTALPAELERGATYYIADGNYESYTFDDAESETEYITIKKAIEGDHGTDIGWQASYGDGQALFDILTFSTSYWVFDGQKRDDDWESGYGFKIKPDESYQFSPTKGIRLSWTDHITFRYIEIEQFGQRQSEVRQEGFYGGDVSEILVQYSYIHDFMGNGILLHGDNNIVEYSKIANSFGYEGTHSQGVQLFSSNVRNMTVRHSIFQDIRGTAAIACAWGTDGLNVYGNIFYNTPGSSGFTSPATIVDISDPDEIGLTNARIYNNLFYRYNHMANGGHPGVMISYTSDSSTNLIYNNLFVDCEEVALDGNNAIHDYNYLINSTWVWNAVPGVNDSVHTGSDPIVDADNGDFRLSAGALPINAGLDLTTLPGFNPDSVDPDQNIRGSDGFWDIGAYEYTDSSGISNPDSYAMKLYQNYPNPFISETIFEYELHGTSKIEISLYDITGSKVRTFYSGMQSEGSHAVRVSGEDLTSGIYFLELKDARFTNVRKCLLIK